MGSSARARRLDHTLKRSRSLSGTPIILAITIMGSGAAKAFIRSNSSAPSTLSTRPCAVARMKSSSLATERGVKDAVHVGEAGHDDLPGQDAVVDRVEFAKAAVGRIRVGDEVLRERPPGHAASEPLLNQPGSDVDRPEGGPDRVLRCHSPISHPTVRGATSRHNEDCRTSRAPIPQFLVDVSYLGLNQRDLRHVLSHPLDGL